MKIYGASDDLVEFEDHDQADEIGCYGADVRFTINDGAGGGLIVVMSYAPDDFEGGCWQARVAPLDDDVPCPWPVNVTCSGYSAVVEIRCPKSVPVAIDKRKAGDRKRNRNWLPIGMEDE